EGKFQLQYKRVLGDSLLSSVSIHCDPLFRKLETGNLDLVVSRWIRRWALGTENETRVYTPEELIRAAAKLDAKQAVTVQFRVRLVDRAVPIRPGPIAEGWVLGHAPDDVCLHPTDRLDFTKEQLTAVLAAKAIGQLRRLGV